MPSPTLSSALPPRRLSTNATKDDDSGLTQSLSQLSLDHPNDAAGSRRHSETPKPLKPQSRRTSRSPSRRLPSRSPSHGGRSRPTTPPLLRKASMNSLHSTNGTALGRPKSRRSSSNQLPSPKTTRSPSFGGSAPPEEASQPATASSVANNFFHAELEAHHGPESTLPTDTIVILHDAVYGHRFARPRTSRNALSTIVERPERVKAAVLGVSMAYVRLGERHCDGAYPAHPRTNIHELPHIPFRIRKSSRRIPLTSPAVTNVHGVKWMEELKLMCESAESKLAMGGRELQRPEMQRSFPAEKLHEGDLYLCSESLNAMEGALGAVCDAIDVVFSPAPAPRRAFVGVRPPGHHCSASHPSGFCWVNNVLVGMMHASIMHGLTHAAIIDFDLHHGDGSQAIVWQHNARAAAARKNAPAWEKTTIGYFSLHDINSYPCEMGDPDKVKNASLCIDNAHGQSIWNVHLQPWKTEQEFWAVYESKYSAILEKTRSYLRNQANILKAANQEPKAAIFFSAGFDASEWEGAGMQRHQVNVPTEFYARLSQDVVKIAGEAGLAVDGRVISVLEGGYSDRALFSGVFSHLSGLTGGQQITKEPTVEAGLGYEMGQKLGTISEPEGEALPTKETNDARAYNPEWWSSSQLDSIEHIMSSPPSPPRKPRSNAPPTYFSPTQASNAKVIDPAKVRRSLSGLSSTVQRPRPQSPTTPDVPWAVAAHELSKILIPSNRQTDSCKPEDLNAEATRARRDRQSILLGIPPTPTASERPTSRMSLRERKPKIMNSIEGGDGTADDKKSYATPRRRSRSRSGRSKGPSESGRTTPSTELPYRRRSSRRLSGTPGPSSPTKEDNVPVPPLPAQYEHAASRPATSAGSRADSSLSNHGQDTAKLNVKKTRPRATTPKESMPKTPQNNRRATPSRQAKTAVKPRAKSVTVSPTAPASEPPVPPVNKMPSGSGAKKIKINLITPAQREARERSKSQEAEKAQNEAAVATADATSSSPAAEAQKTETPRLAPVHTATVETSPLQLDPSSSNFLSRATESGLSTPNEVTPTDIPSPLEKKGNGVASHAQGGIPALGEQMTSTTNSDVFITYQPEGPAPAAVSRDEPLKWLPPNIPTPSANTPATTPSTMKKTTKNGNGLFHYTSGIPFAPKAKTEESGPQPSDVKTSPTKPKMEKQEKSLWEVPEATSK